MAVKDLLENYKPQRIILKDGTDYLQETQKNFI